MSSPLTNAQWQKYDRNGFIKLGKLLSDRELAAGEVALLHNWLLHSSGVNTTDKPRRGFSACYMVAGTRDSRPPHLRDSVVEQVRYPPIFGDDALDPAQLAGRS